MGRFEYSQDNGIYERGATLALIFLHCLICSTRTYARKLTESCQTRVISDSSWRFDINPENTPHNLMKFSQAAAVMATVRIVLVEPAGARNVGAIARVLKNMGLTQLAIVNPHCDPQGAEARQMAVHAQEVLDTALIVPSLSDALRGSQRVMGTVGRLDVPEITPSEPRTALTWLLAVESAALVFGPEDRGLSNAELGLCQRWLTIPVNPAYPSLNLAQAVGICAYELHLASTTPASTVAAPFCPSDHQLREAFYSQLEALLLQIGYLYPQTAAKKMRKLRRLFDRAEPSPAEIAQLRGILGQLSWAEKHYGD